MREVFEHLAAILLAGGKGRRMGRDKAFLDVRGRPMVAWMSERLAQAGLLVWVVAPASRLARLTALGLRATADVYEGHGPLAGLHAGLLAAGDGYHFLISCDQPLFEPAFAHHLLHRAAEERVDAAVPFVGGHLQVLHAAYHRRVAGSAERLLRSGERRVYHLLDHVRWLRVDEEEIQAFGDAARLFFNINTPDDLGVLESL